MDDEIRFVEFSEAKMGKFMFERLIAEYGYCIDKELENAIAAIVFDYLDGLGILDYVEYEDGEEDE
jgi:hypothetical protein